MMKVNVSTITLLAVFITFFFQSIQAQNSSERDSVLLRTFASPSDISRLKINGELQDSINEFHLPPGKYQLSFWAPNYQRVDTTIQLADKPLNVGVKLEPTDELISYWKQDEVWKKHKGRVVAYSAITTLFVGAAILNYNRVGDFNREYVENKNGYDYNVNGYTQSLVDDSGRRLDNARYLQYGIYTLGTATLVGAVVNYIKMKKNTPGDLPEDKSFYVQDFGLNLNHNENNFQFNLVLNF